MLMRTRRAGFSLAELLVVMVILALVMTSVTMIFIQQQRFYTGTAAMIQSRASTRDAGFVMSSELRGLAPRDSDVYAMGTSFVDYRTTFGASVVCTINGTRKTLTLPPTKLATLAGLTTWLQTPASGDTILVFDPDTIPGPAGDTWRKYTLTAVPTAGASCPNSTGLTTTASEANQGWTLQITPALTNSTPVGAPIRFVRHAHYELYQETSTAWYLGYYDCVPSRSPVCNPLQAVAGPYLAPNTGGGGIVFTFRDSTGAVTADRFRVRRIDIMARAQTQSSVRVAGYRKGNVVDSLFTTISPRN